MWSHYRLEPDFSQILVALKPIILALKPIILGRLPERREGALTKSQIFSWIDLIMLLGFLSPLLGGRHSTAVVAEEQFGIRYQTSLDVTAGSKFDE